MRFLLCFVIVLFCSCHQQLYQKEKENLSPPAFDFMHQDQTLTAVIDRAIAEDKLVFVDIYTDWCLPCKMMDEEVFTDQALGEFFNANFINFKVDAEKDMGPDIAFLFSVNAYPTLLFLDTQGRVVKRKIGSAFQAELRQLAAESIEMVKGE